MRLVRPCNWTQRPSNNSGSHGKSSCSRPNERWRCIHFRHEQQRYIIFYTIKKKWDICFYCEIKITEKILWKMISRKKLFVITVSKNSELFKVNVGEIFQPRRTVFNCQPEVVVPLQFWPPQMLSRQWRLLMMSTVIMI